MIRKTGLPYNMEQLDAIIEDGAIVDMADINFPGVTAGKQARTALIYLRNTGAEHVTLDFSRCAYEQKADFLDEFICSDIEVELKDAVDAWMEILLVKTKLLDIEQISIFSPEEFHRFEEKYNSVIEELLVFLVSSPLYLMYRNKYIQGVEEDFDNFTVKEISKNALQFFKHPLLEQMIIQQKIVQPKFCANIFTKKDENNKLFNTINSNLVFACIMYSMITSEPDEWNQFIKKLEGESQ